MTTSLNRKKVAILILVIIAVTSLMLLVPPQEVQAIDTIETAEDSTGNIIITIHTNKDVDKIVMHTNKGDIDITPSSEYGADEEDLRGNNQVLDVNGDMLVNELDYEIEKAHVEGSCKDFTAKERCPHCGATDIDDDGDIDEDDLAILESHLEGSFSCELDDCYFHGKRTYREEDPEDSSRYIWTINYTPTIAGIDEMTFTPQSYTSTGVVSGEVKTLTIHAEEYKNPEVVKYWVSPENQDKYLVEYKSGKPIIIYAVTPLETDKVKFHIENELDPTDVTEVEVTEWDSIDYDTAEKTWKFYYDTSNRGWRNIEITAYGEQSEDNGGWLEGTTITMHERIVDPQVLTCNTTTTAGLLEVWYVPWSYTDADGNSHSGSTRHERQWYNHTTTAVCNDDTDYVYFTTSGGSSYSYSYSTSGDTRTFTKSWTDLSAGATGKAEAYCTIGTTPDPVYEYDVIYNANGGLPVDPTTAEYDTLLSSPPTPERAGYDFVGWYKEERCINEWDFSSDTVKGTTTLFAKWEAKIYTVTFDTQDGEESTTKNSGYDQTINAPNDPERENYEFDGWFKNAACTSRWDFGADRIYDDTTLYAKWTPNTVKVSFVTKGGNDIAPIAAIYGQVMPELEEPTLTGYQFDGWYKDDACTIPWDIDNELVTEPTVLYAKWSLGYYTVSFVDSVNTDTVYDSIETNANQLIEATDVIPERAGYTFTNWFQDPECTKLWVFSLNKVHSATILYAGWTSNQATISFVTNGGSTISSISGRTDEIISDREFPGTSRLGYTFMGWYENEDFNGDVVTELPETYPPNETVYYAKWSANAAWIMFDTNEGTAVDSMSGITDQEISDTTMPETSREGYTFLGWFKETDFSGSVIQNLPEKFPANVTTYHAKWVGNRSYIQFITGGKGYISRMAGYTDDIIADRTLPEISASGYTFAGWFDNAEFSGDPLDQLPEKFPIGTQYLYAKWEASTSTFHFESNTTDTVDDIVGVTDEAVTDRSMPVLTRSGYSFSGWFEEEDFSGYEVTELPELFPVDGQTYYASWTPNLSTLVFVTNGGEAIDNMYGGTDEVITDRTMPVPVREGYSFMGWYENEDLSGDVVIELPESYPIDGKTYYASWAINSYTVVFDSQGGSIVTSQIALYDTLITEPSDPTKSGYVMHGWYLEPECINQFDFTIDTVTDNMTLYAKWAEESIV